MGVFLALLLLKVAAFFATTILLGKNVYPRVSRGLKTMQATALEFSALPVTAVGIGMSARGAIELVVLSIAYEAGLFSLSGENEPVSGNLFSALVLTGVITTMLAPSLLRMVLPKMPD